MIVLVVLVTGADPAAEHRYSREFVLTQIERLAETSPSPAALLCQSPYHWAAAYGLAAVLLVVLAIFRQPAIGPDPEGG